MSILSRARALFSPLASSPRYQQLFARSDAKLASQGLSRDALARSYISGIGAQ
ncbi:MAG: hypothetical protein HKO95_16615 [Rhodobacteraceae bacterium]|nr:hypothetical protein [Alphaproteobacteria bacterium]MBT8474144.1 hypothetical protein [Alphaproteobacteria bacterium]NNF73321.1 hypothetical protein [Paracoccaceae bacterium]NNK68349.1 hypothetical protein [Paracoccaceae bacterium]